MNKSKQSVEIFNKLASAYEEKFMDVSGYHKSFDTFCSSIKRPNAEILELACGPGNITKYLLNKRPDFKLLGTDMAPNMIELAKKNNPTAQFELMDCRAISSVEKKYDGIMCGFALPYLTKEDAIKLIGDASRILNEKGIIYISTMEDDYSKSRFQKGSSGDEMFMHYHEGDYLINALEENGFRLIELIRQDYVQPQNHKERQETAAAAVMEEKQQEAAAAAVIDLILIAQK